MATSWGGSCWSGKVADEGRNEAKRRRTDGTPELTVVPAGSGVFEELPDELVVSILADVVATANSPADLAAAMLTCRRFRELAQHKLVLARASPRCVAVRANGWSDDAQRFLLRCSGAGNIDASYLLGMIRFYCLGSRRSGSELMALAALRGHAEALYSLAIIQFNGSGRSKEDRNLHAGAQLCARAAERGHTDALRELGHCVSDGYGIRQSIFGGRRLLIHANFREICAVFRGQALAGALGLRGAGKPPVPHTCLLSDFGCHVAAGAGRRAHAANAFLAEWFASRPVGVAEGHELRLCSQPACGRPETRQNEFRRCSVCNVVIYCSRACQALHWRAGHKEECTPVNRLLDAANINANAVAAAIANINADTASADAGGGNADAPAAVSMAMP